MEAPLPPGHIAFVGAGPGDPDLLTLRAFTRLREADLILRDILVPDHLLEATATRARIINVGRLCGGPESQDDRLRRINQAMLEAYGKGQRVVRLKSGDSLVFGRAVEELHTLIEQRIPFELVPGITAGLAAANLAVVPLTEREVAPSVLFCTGQTAGGGEDHIEAWASLLRGGSTVVLYMGLKALTRIAPRLLAALPHEDIHVTAVSQVSAATQQTCCAPLREIEAALRQRPLPTPVVFILGQSARPLPLREVAKFPLSSCHE